MEKNERLKAEVIRDKLAKILPDLKLAYENAKNLEFNHGWDTDCFEMCEAYMNLAHEFIYIMAMLDDDKKGGEK